jgi:hypothetical protein
MMGATVNISKNGWLPRLLAAGVVASAIVATTTEASAEPRTHDGFYLQLDAGLGYVSESFGDTDVSLSGVSFPSALLIGGSLSPGLVLGGILSTDYVPSPSAGDGNTSVLFDDVSLYVFGIGPFVDFYPDPLSGLHFQAMLGWGGTEHSFKGNAGGSDPTGLMLSIGAGHDWWVGDEWSIGVMGRFAYGAFSLEDTSYSTIAPAVLATFTYN